nr:uncharacterized protein LOC113724212 [Coffea arabica]
MATTPVSWEPDDEWELINDDGFVYKHRKRPRVDLPSSTSAPGLSDPAVEEQNRRQRKKRALLKLKHKYQQEIEHQQQKYRQPDDAATSSYRVTTTSPVPPEQSSDSACQHLVNELLLQTEAQKSIIGDVARLCDVAEALCSATEENFTKSFTELPVWALKPHELMTSLYED